MDNWRRFRATVGNTSAANPNGAPGALNKDGTQSANGSSTDTTDPKGKARALDDTLWGLENFGNTCYCNSVLQALYASPPFRHFIEAYPDVGKPYNALGGDVATEPIQPPSPDPAKANPLETQAAAPKEKEKRSGVFGLGRSKGGGGGAHGAKSGANNNNPTLQPAAAAAAAPTPPPIILPPDPNFPEMTLFSTIQTLFHHMSSSMPHHPAAPKAPVAANGQMAANNTASLPSPSLSVQVGPNGQLVAAGQQPPGPPLLASLPPPSTSRGGGPYAAGTLGRGVVRPEDVLRTVRRHHALFAGQGQQDAHEFLGFILNQLDEEVARLDNQLKERGDEVTTIKEHGKTFVQQLFHGDLVNETRCLNCETTSRREESFLDLSIDIEQHSSLTACLRQFSHSEMLCSTNKFYCETCCSLVEAERRMRIKSLPNILGLHLKRFRQDEMGRLHKLFYRVTFPLQLRVPCTTEDTEDGERLYELFAVVVHIGNGPTHGHYVTVVRSGGQWVMCDDENVEPIEESDLANYFGDNITGAGYVLFYQAVDLDLLSLGLKKLPEPRVLSPQPIKQTSAISEISDEGVAVSGSELGDSTHFLPEAAAVAAATSAALKPADSDSSVNGSFHVVESATPSAAVSAAASTAPSALPSREPTLDRRDPSTAARRDGSLSRSPIAEKSKWYNLKKKGTADSATHSNGSLPSTESRGGLRRQSTATTLNTVSTTSVPQADAAHEHSGHAGAPAADLTASMMSTTSGASSAKSSVAAPSGTPAAPLTAALAAHAAGAAAHPHPQHQHAHAHAPPPSSYSPPKPSAIAAAASPAASPAASTPASASGAASPADTRSRSRSQSASHGAAGPGRSASSSSQQAKDGGYGGGSGLSRRISGAAGFGKLSRSTSNAFKMGFGKKKVEE